MQTISYLGCLGLFPASLTQFAFEMCVAVWSREKFTNYMQPFSRWMS